MFLCWSTYNKKPILLVVVGTKAGKTIGLKVREHNGPELLSEPSIARLRLNIDKLIKLDIDSRIFEIKRIISEFNSVYRTYDSNKLKILQQYQISPL